MSGLKLQLALPIINSMGWSAWGLGAWVTVLTALTLSSRNGWCTPVRAWWGLMGGLGAILLGLLVMAGGGWVTTPYVWVGQVVVIVLALALFYVIQREQAGRHSVEYPLLLGFALLGLLLLLVARDLLLFVAAVELLSLTLYLLAALQNRSAYVVEAGMKYLVLGSLGSGLLLFGTTLLYGLSGLLSFTSLLYYFTSLPTVPFGIVLGVLFFLMGLLFKVAAFPFYVWAPDVYEGVPLPVTIFFAVIVKFTVFFVLVALLSGVFMPLQGFWGPLLVLLGLLTLAVGAIGGLCQKRLKRLLAYSSISNAGFLLVALGAVGLGSDRSVLYYLLVYTFTVFLLFLFLFLLNCRGGVVTYITDLSYCTNFPIVWLVLFTVATLSLAGMPPLVGFLAKYGVLFSVLRSSFHWLLPLVFFFQVIGFFYYVRLLKVTFFEVEEWAPSRPFAVSDYRLSEVLLGGVCLALFMLPYYTEVLSNLSGWLSYWVIDFLEPETKLGFLGWLMPYIRTFLAGARVRISRLVLGVLPYLRQIQQFAFKYKFPLGVVYLVFCLYFHLYIRLGITVIFVLLLGLGQLPWVKMWRERYAADCLIIQTHWERDPDLIQLWFYVKSCYAGSVLALVLFFTCLFFELGVYYNEMGFPSGISWRIEWVPLVALVLFLIGSLVVLGADLHIIWRRNTPAKYQTLAAIGKFGYTSLKVAVAGGIPLVGGMELITRLSVVEPNYVTNTWRIKSPLGPKFGYVDQAARLRHYALLMAPDYDPVLYAGKSGMLTHPKLDVAVKMNLPYIHKNFSFLVQQGVQAPMKLPFTAADQLNLRLDSQELLDLINSGDKKQ